MVPSGRWSILPVHLGLNAIVLDRGFNATKSRTAVNDGDEYAKSRFTRCLSCRTSSVRSVEVSRKSFNDGMLPEMILGPT